MMLKFITALVFVMILSAVWFSLVIIKKKKVAVVQSSTHKLDPPHVS